MSWKSVKLKKVLKQYRIEHWVQNEVLYKQVTISKYDGVSFRGKKLGNEIGRKRQFLIDLKEYPNTLLFIRQGVQEGGIGIAPNEVDGCIVTENMPMFSIEGINVDYLNFIIKSPLFKDELNKLVPTGSAQKAIHENQLLEIEIPLPGRTEQEEIVYRLHNFQVSYQELHKELDQQQTYLQHLRQTILQEAVQGKLTKQDPTDEPATELLKRIKAEKEKLIKAGKLKKEKELPPITEDKIPFELPEGWVWCRLQEVTILITDGKHGDSPNQTNSGYYFLSAKDVKSGKLNYENARQITYEGFLETHKRTDLKPGDICLVNTGATIGKIAIAEDNELTPRTTFQKSVAVIKVLQQLVMVDYVEMFLRGSVSHLVKTSGGSAINNLLLGDLKHLLFPLPPLAEQQRIAAKVQQLQQQLSLLEAQVQQSRQYAQQLLQTVLRQTFDRNKMKDKAVAQSSIMSQIAI